MTTIPDSMPMLSAGAHGPDEGRACVMEYVSLLAGEEWSDGPSCTHSLLASVARKTNDSLIDDFRHLLVPLIGRLFGTTNTSSEITLGLVTWSLGQLDDITPTMITEPMIREARISGNEVIFFSRKRNIRYFSSAEYCVGMVSRVIMDSCWVFSDVSIGHYDTNTMTSKAIEFLSGLIDEYDRLSGRTDIREVSETDLARLRRTVDDHAMG